MNTDEFKVSGNVLIRYEDPHPERGDYYGDFGYYGRYDYSPFSRVEENVLEIPNNLGITEIGDEAFRGCSATKIIIPEGVIKIGKSAFRALRNLEEVVLPSTLQVIGEDSFRKCPELRTIHFSTGLKVIEEDAFCDNRSLEYILVPEGVIEIGKGAFRDNPSLKEAKLPESLQKLDKRVFENCSSLVRANIPKNIKEIPVEIFNQCTSLQDVTFADDIISMGHEAFGNCNELNPFQIPKTVKKYGFGSGYEVRARVITGVRKLEELHLPEGVTVIGDYDLYGLTGLKKLYLPLSVKDIGPEICEDSDELSYVEMPFDVSLSPSAFSSTSKIRRFSFIYLDDRKKKNSIVADIESFKEIAKRNDRFVILDKEGNIITVTKNKVDRFSIAELIKATNSNSEFDVDWNYKTQTRLGRYDIIMKWHEMKKKSGQSENLPLPQSFVLSTIPFNEEEIKRYYQRHKLFDELLELSKFDKEEQKSDLLKLCYSVGLFSGNKDECSRAYDFIKTNLENGLLNGDYVHFTYDTYNLTNGYNPKFADFYIANFSGNHSILRNISGRIYNEFKKIIKEFKKTDGTVMDMSFVTDYLVNHKYDVRYGNEMLAEEIKKYIDSYSSEDFEVMQDLFEKARRIAEKQSKKIVDTTDTSKKYSYFWSAGDNPVNMVLGNAVGCCARYNGAGQGIMEASMFDASVRNLIIYNKDKQIVGKATAYYNGRKKYILFNNAEMSQSFLAKARAAGKRDAFDAILRAVHDQVEVLNSDPKKIKVKKVVMGMRYNDLGDEIMSRDLPIVTDPDEMLENYHFTVSTPGAYEYEGDATDPSYGQVVLWEHEKKNARTK